MYGCIFHTFGDKEYELIEILISSDYIYIHPTDFISVIKAQMRKEIIVLYGSQSGNAESIAKDAANSIQNLCSSVPSTIFSSIICLFKVIIVKYVR